MLVALGMTGRGQILACAAALQQTMLYHLLPYLIRGRVTGKSASKCGETLLGISAKAAKTHLRGGLFPTKRIEIEGDMEKSVMANKNNGVSLLDPVLAEVLIRWFAKEGGSAFDPFAGDTVFGYVAASLGLPFTGIELRKAQVDLNNARTQGLAAPAKYICDDGQNILQHLAENSQDFLFSCPPYYDLEVYSDLPNDASNQETYEDFLVIIRNALLGAIKALKDNRFAAIVCGDIRDKAGYYRGFPEDIKHIFAEGGMRLYNEMVLIEPLGTLPQRVNRYMHTRKVGKCHQSVLVFYKGDINEIPSNYKEIKYAGENLESFGVDNAD